MPWFMVDDKLHGHRKRIRAGIEAMGLWVVAGSWCADHLMDGFVPGYVAREIDSKATRHAASLVEAGLWSVDEVAGEPGWRFHDWASMQPTRADVEAKREAARERMRKVRAPRGSQEVRENIPELQAKFAGSSRTPAQPSPSQPIRSSGSSSGGGEPTATRAQKRPPRSCAKHPNGTDDPCGPCADARKIADAWKPPTFAAKTMCGDHPKHPALNCPECATEVVPAPAGFKAELEALARRKSA